MKILYHFEFLGVWLPIFFLAFSGSVSLAQESPAFFVEKFDTSTSYRTNVCDRQRLLLNQSLDFPDALRGLNLTVALTNYANSGINEKALFSLNENGQIPELSDITYPGIFAIILDELALRAGFSWRNSFAVYEPRNATTDGNKTWTDILDWAIHTYDISMEKWGHTKERLALGASFPQGWWDSSIVLGELRTGQATREVVNYWSFLEPFHYSVWALIVVTVIATGMTYWLLEHWNKDADERDLDSKPMASIFYAAIAFTGHYEMQPNTHPARIVGFSFTFWALIIGSAYTANLAGFLVSPRITVFNYGSIQNVLRQDAVVCVQGGAIIETSLKERYPGIRTVGFDSEQAIYEGLRLPIEQGGCDATAHQLNSFEIYENSKTVNSDCSLSSEKRVVDIFPAGMATVVDNGLDKCTSLVSHVLDYHLTAMVNDGFIQEAWNSHLNRISSIECIQEVDTTGYFDDDIFGLTVKDLAGIFLVHGVLSVVAVLWGIYHFVHSHRKGNVHESRSLQKALGLHFMKKTSRESLSVNTTDKARNIAAEKNVNLGVALQSGAIGTEPSQTSFKLPSVNSSNSSRGGYIDEAPPSF